ncbi:MAG: beta-galactosidase [Oscillospiraceae bacterium]|nr:beta-galactosidase [Oscillospiraceae bacterium]
MLFHIPSAIPHPTTLPLFGDETITVTDHMLLKKGRPYLPVMGELHYSRVPRQNWREELLKMKAGGIDVVASYVFWIHHEENEGCFDFSDNRDIRSFIELCLETGLEFCLRIGPWAHGECRNGGFPDWLCEKCAGQLRSEKEPYFGYVCRYIKNVAEQVKNLPLFGIQIENEMTKRPDYMEKLRRIVIENGLTAPLFTATAWGNASLPETLLPMFGGYPCRPWDKHIDPLPYNANYFFSHAPDACDIGTDILDNAVTASSLQFMAKFPFFTCELGGGNQISYHRRPMLNSKDVEALAICKLGSGANLLGYYMYHGGLNPKGKTYMQESKATGYPNDYPLISYDFQSPLGDNGQIRESYFRLGKIHEFIHNYGELLAPMHSVMPEEMPKDYFDTDTIRCALRTDGKGAFLFINNHLRLTKRPAYPNTTFELAFSDRTLSFTLDVPSDCCFFIPVNMDLAGLSVDHITAQPVALSQNSITLLEIEGLAPIVALTDGRKIPLTSAVTKIDGVQIILEAPKEYIPTPLTELTVTETENTLSADDMLSHLNLSDRTAEYRICWPEGTTYLVIKATGNLAAFYSNGQMISDFYLYGNTENTESWVIDVRHLAANEGILKIQPFSHEDEVTVYLEMPIPFGKHIPKVYATKDNVLYI